MNKRQLNQYTLLYKLGGSGRTYAALDRRSFQMRVIKILDRASYQREVYFLRRLHQDGVPQLLETMEQEGRYYLVLNREPGCTLEQYLRQKSPLTEQEILSIMLPLCMAVNDLHKHRPCILHLDLKLSNIMRNKNDSICLLDFESAREVWPDGTTGDPIRGTPGYAAPEQGEKEKLGVYSDIYAIGQILVRLLQHSRIKHRLCWKRICRRATHLDPMCRYPDLEQMLEEIQHIQEKRILRRKRVKRERGISAVLALVIIGCFSFLWEWEGTAESKGTEHSFSVQKAADIQWRNLELFRQKQAYIALVQAGQDFAIDKKELLAVLQQQEDSLITGIRKEGPTWQQLERYRQLCVVYRVHLEKLGEEGEQQLIGLCSSIRILVSHTGIQAAGDITAGEGEEAQQQEEQLYMEWEHVTEEILEAYTER